MMGLHKLTAGDGYTYLTRQVAAVDATERGYDSLESYYSAKGESPGRWMGRGAATLGVAGEQVTEDQMLSLFGEGRHPNATRLAIQALAEGRGEAVADAAGALGARFAVYSGETSWRTALAEAYEAYNARVGHPHDYPVPEEDRRVIRTEVGTWLFTEQHGRPPSDTQELSGFIRRMARPQTTAVAGYDLTFSPVKSISTLWAVGSVQTAQLIEQAHDAAVAKAIDFVQQEAGYTRVGTRGVRQVRTSGITVAAFRHRDSRNGDPDLHTHCAVSNKVEMADSPGRWLALDGRMLHRIAVDASEFYNVQLEAEVIARMGGHFYERDMGPNKRPVREYAGVEPALNERFSTRRAQIEQVTADLAAQFVADHGRVPSAAETVKLAQQATLSTRQRKHEPRSLAEQRRQWRDQALEMLGEPGLAHMLESVSATLATRAATATLVDEIAVTVIDRVADSRATWRRPNVRAEARRQLAVAGFDPAAVNDLADVVADRALSADHCLPLTGIRGVPAATPAAVRRPDGTSHYTVAGAQQYTSHRLVAAENRILAAAGRTDAWRLDTEMVDLAMLQWSAQHPGKVLNHGQAAMLRDIATSGRRVHLALAPAGTGKTTVMQALAGAYHLAGGTVLGLAPQATAAAELSAAMGDHTHADTLDKLVHDVTHTDPQHWAPWIHDIGEATLVVVDEAGLAATPKLDAAIEFIVGRGGQVLLLGDDRQRAAIGAGGVLRDIDAAHGSTTLTEVMRFTNRTEGQASLAVRAGDPAAAGFYLDRGRLHLATRDSVVQEVFTAWSADTRSGRDSIMMAPTLDQVAQLNQLARQARLQARTLLLGVAEDLPELPLPSGELVCAGDIVVTKSNDRRLWLGGTDFVKNGDRWSVAAITTAGGLTVTHLKTGAVAELPAEYLADGWVRLGYAHTIAGSQGVTVGTRTTEGTAHAIVPAGASRNDLYPALTRAVTENHVYLLTGGPVAEGEGLTDPATQSPGSAAELFAEILGRDGSARSLHTEEREAQAPATQLAHAAGVYRDTIPTAAEALLGPDIVEQITSGAEQAAPGVTTAAAWPVLLGHLCTIQAFTRADADAVLTAAAAARELDTAGDKAAVLDWRLDHTGRHSLGQGPLPWLPGLPTGLAQLPEWGPFITAWHRRVTEHLAALTEHSTQWTPATAPRWALPYLADQNLLADLAAWRATEQVPDEDLRPAGPPPPGARIALRQYHRDLVSRATKISGDPTDGAARWERILAYRGVDPTPDSWWPVLAGRLSLADTAGLPVPQLLAAALDHGPLPAEHQAAALWWRLAPHLAHIAGIGETHHGQRIRPPWTEQLAALVGTDITNRLVDDPTWPALVARLDTAARDGHDPAALITSAASSLITAGSALRPHEQPTVLLWTVAALTDPEPPNLDHEPAHPDPADHDLTPPADWNPHHTTRSTLLPQPDERPDVSQRPDIVPDGIATDLTVDEWEPPAEPDLDDELPPDPEQEPDPDTDPAQAERLDRLHTVLRVAADYYTEQARRSWVPDYITSRGLDPDRFGYAPRGGRYLVSHLRHLGYTDGDILAAGLARTNTTTGQLYDFFRNRAVRPITTPDGHIAAFIGRRHPDAGDDSGPKYINTPTTAAFTKGELPYGLDLAAVAALQAGADLAICEGVPDADAINIAGEGRIVAIAPLGTALTDQHLALLEQHAPLAGRTILVATDNDDAGNTAAAKTHQLLAARGIHTAHRITTTDKDPADTLQHQGREALTATLQGRSPLVDAAVDDMLRKFGRDNLAEVETQMAITAAVGTLLRTLPEDQGLRQILRTAEHLGEDPFRTLDSMTRYLPLERDPVLDLPLPPARAAEVPAATPARRARLQQLLDQTRTLNTTLAATNETRTSTSTAARSPQDPDTGARRERRAEADTQIARGYEPDL